MSYPYLDILPALAKIKANRLTLHSSYNLPMQVLTNVGGNAALLFHAAFSLALLRLNRDEIDLSLS